MKLLTDTDYIHALIAEGEHQQQDFKFEISDARKIAKTLSAFANTDGGRLLIGVKDNDFWRRDDNSGWGIDDEGE